jgi:hypothetical protein
MYSKYLVIKYFRTSWSHFFAEVWKTAGFSFTVLAGKLNGFIILLSNQVRSLEFNARKSMYSKVNKGIDVRTKVNANKIYEISPLYECIAADWAYNVSWILELGAFKKLLVQGPYYSK